MQLELATMIEAKFLPCRAAWALSRFFEDTRPAALVHTKHLQYVYQTVLIKNANSNGQTTQG